MRSRTTWFARHRLFVVAAVAALAGAAGAVGVTYAAQPHMVNALRALEGARNELQVAEHNKGGHRVNALRLVNEAIGKVQAGIAAGGG